MNEILQECKVLGYKPCVVKDTHEEMIRICIEMKTNKDGYYGTESKYIFLPDTEQRRNILKNAVDNKTLEVNLKVNVDIINNNSKVIDIIIK